MIPKAIARRYGCAMFYAAKENGLLDQVAADFQLVMRFLEQSPELRELLSHQRITTRHKKEIARNLWQNRVSQLFLGFIELIIDNRRENYLGEIPEAYHNLLRSERNIVVAEVATALPIDESLQSRLQEVLERRTGKQVELRISVHPELIGGLAVKIGDRIYDGSAVKRLELMGARLAQRSLGKLEVGS